mmetsp:Transcript_24268/g.41765  ORF Transcript_24268/g.41765 Transcript_24268/m.41765 type:complete len:350 (-) Transcript_24268:392-1441(-)|eukprot:CAMPEP_0196653616 /NCGR_PEP_ID=MMETSP1086-20130531/3268_1 /TAXON_ID=77921 /ORGANISM="Cyanoptyche  gloeocystis , Strain SAG4.97" /LENGTH=349 /DNA_ID=CAMNT_0041984909 /DNA_START=68 /DNA_END=1117 /DNA_ORIENTATION=-
MEAFLPPALAVVKAATPAVTQASICVPQGSSRSPASSSSRVSCSFHARGFRQFEGFRHNNAVDQLTKQTKAFDVLHEIAADISESASSAGIRQQATCRGVVIAGNWKMNKTITEAVFFVEALKAIAPKNNCGVYIGVPFTCIDAVAKACIGTQIVVGAQNMSDKASGAYTGEVSGDMIKEAGAKFVILGHSERRQYYGETDAIVNAKVKKALADGLQPIVCIGESLEQREGGVTEKVLDTQIRGSLADLTGDQMKNLIIAYEPIWAIGTGKTATPEIAQSTHAFIRKVLTNVWGPQVADSVIVQYGGSVTPDNVKTLMAQPDIDGALVGGASLAAESFAKLVDYNLVTA